MNRFLSIGIVSLLLTLSFPATLVAAEECSNDSLYNYFPLDKVLSIFQIDPPTSISGKGINYTCNGGSFLFHFDILNGKTIQTRPNGPIVPIGFKYEIVVSIRKEADARGAIRYFRSEALIETPAIATPTFPPAQRSSLELGDDSALLETILETKTGNIITEYIGVVRRDNFVFTVKAQVMLASLVDSLGMPEAYTKLNAPAVARKVKELLTFALAQPASSYVKPDSTQQPNEASPIDYDIIQKDLLASSFLRYLFAAFLALAAFFIIWWLIKKIRKNKKVDQEPPATPPVNPTLPPADSQNSSGSPPNS